MNHKATPDEVNAEDYCGTFYAAKLLRLSVGTIQSLVEKNELQAWKTKGGHRRISMQSVREYQQKRGLGDLLEKRAQLRLLVVEDDEALLEVIRASVESWNLPIDCTTMTSAFEAMLDMGSIRPDVLMTDINMPGVDGFELIRRISSNPMFANMTILVVTGMSAEQVKSKGLLPDRVRIIHKPVDFKWLHGFFSAITLFREQHAESLL